MTAAEALAAVSRPDADRTPLPIGPPAAEVWDAICRGIGIERLSPEEATALPPWTEEEAAAFERAVMERP